MKFGDKIKKFREDNGYTQSEFSKLIGIGMRTLSMYENGERYPRDQQVYKKFANIMKCDYNYLLGDEDMFLSEVYEKHGAGELRKVDALTEGISSMFAGGEISDEDRDAAFAAITKAYWKAKEENKKYGRKKEK